MVLVKCFTRAALGSCIGIIIRDQGMGTWMSWEIKHEPCQSQVCLQEIQTPRPVATMEIT